jgi:hypothetical protein
MKALVVFSIAVTALGLPGLRAETAATPPVMLVVPGVMAETPTGEGDPNAILCRAPQYIPGNAKIGPELCLHNSEWWKLAANGKDIAADGKTLIERPTVVDPKGAGDPEAVTCTLRFATSGPQIKVCRTNRFWAEAARNHQQINAWGEVVRQRSGAFGELCSSCGTGGDPGHDSGYASQSSATP